MIIVPVSPRRSSFYISWTKQLKRKMLQWTGCWHRSRELKLSCDPSKKSVWNKIPIRLSSFKIMTVYLLPAQFLFSSGLWTLFGRCQPLKDESVWFALPFCFLLSHVLRFSQIVSALFSFSAVGHWVSQHLKHQTLEWSALERILLFASNAFSGHEQLLCLTWWFLYQSLIGRRPLTWHSHSPEWSETGHLNTRCSFLCRVKFGVPSDPFSSGPFCAPVAGPFSASPLSLSPSFLSDFICRCHPSSQHLTFLHLLSSVLHFSSISSCFSTTTSSLSLSFWLCSLNPLTHWVQHACKGWC